MRPSDHGVGPVQHKLVHVSSWFPNVRSYEPPSQIADLNRVQWRLDPKRAVLLVHDMQRFWLDRLPDASRLVDCVSSLIAAARRAGLPVIYSVAEGAGDSGSRGLSLDRWGPGIGAAGPTAGEIARALAPEAQDQIVRKSRYSAFFKTDLEQALRKADRSQIVITGVFAHHGCLATALDAYMRDIQTFFVADATADYGYDEHLGALRYVGEVCGYVATTTELKAALTNVQGG